MKTHNKNYFFDSKTLSLISLIEKGWRFNMLDPSSNHRKDDRK